MNPGGQPPNAGTCNSWRLPFNEDFTKLAVVSGRPDNQWYYRSAGYVTANAGYTEVATSQSSFEGESGYYAATFYDGQLWVMNRNFEWIDPASGDVRATGPRMDDATGGYTDLYIAGSKDPTGYGLGEPGNCSYPNEKPSHVSTKCYFISNGDIEFYTNKNANNKPIKVKGGACYSLLALDSKDNFYCAEELSNGQQHLVRIDRGTGKARAITPETDQEILQAIISSDNKQVLFTAKRGDDPITAYVVPATGVTGPRELSGLTGQLSEGQKLYRWTAN